ncbi:uncharacterized protein LOC108603731 isoform X1 [Drosophila busckii]|uniref:uncharacterized protein LOC108603731 isoform X1 n=1 Tax=Drosophila busckii TaxID=30019 RepID=UPI0014330BD7|nr:uncharacterized protein LOC108603731 isoform X1 [Drosophila busckii]
MMPTITGQQPHFDVDSAGWNIPKNIALADPLFYKSQRIDLLIGAGLFFELLCVGQIQLAEHLPTLQKTRFGWVVSGGISLQSANHSVLPALSSDSIAQPQPDSFYDIIRKFWEIDSYCGSPIAQTDEDALCEQLFVRTFSRLKSGQYSVHLPAKTSFEMLGDSYDRAVRRFKSLESKLSKNSTLKSQYMAFIKEYLDLGHMSQSSRQHSLPQFYLPHHCVQKLDSSTTKLRVVFDGSAKSTSGYSLNDLLFTGPSIQPKIFNTLLRFRFFKVALCGDICKMYRCVRVTHPDQHLQSILWRDNPNEDIKVYTLDTVTYGTKPAAFLAIRAMQQLSYDEEDNFPLASKIVRRDFYVDDLISGGDSIEDVVQIRQQVKSLLERGHFPIRKWCSNESAALEGESEADREKTLCFHDGTDVMKTLGLYWDTKSDNLLFSFVENSHQVAATKRSILSTVAKFYDPLGLIAPVITRLKIFLQILWKDKLDWDEALPQSLHTLWLDHVSQISAVSHLKFPRFVIQSNALLEIHAFCDASLAAYGACVYVRSESHGIVSTHLLCSKSRVSPLKTLTVPKLELCAALLLSELVGNIAQTISSHCSYHCWSDSTIVLSWIRQPPSEFNIFVSNRIAQIQDRTKDMKWHHVPTDVNPADILSRGCTPLELLESKLWREGPPFLKLDPFSWPALVPSLTDLPERRRSVFILSENPDISYA